MSYPLNNKISDLWNRFSFEFTDPDCKNCMERVPNYYLKPAPNKILFIGLNPAFQSKNKDSLTFSYPVSDERINEIAIDNGNSKIEGQKNYYAKYFGVLNEISSKLEQKGFEHCDMFLMRETNSNIVKRMVENVEGGLNHFGLEQIEILNNYIEDAKPKLIIIINAMSSNYYKMHQLKNQELDAEKGIYYTQTKKQKIPTILCGSWQYGRLDSFTKEIMLFHIKNALK